MPPNIVPESDLPYSLVPADDLPDQEALPSNQPSTFVKESAQPKPIPFSQSISEGGPFGMGAGGELHNYISDMIKKSLLPMIGGAVGAVGGQMVGIPAPVGGSAGAMFGEGVNQRLGITEPSGIQIALAGIADPAMRTLGAAYQATKRILSRTLPGAGASLRTGAVETAQGLAKSIRPATPSEGLYNQVRDINELVPLGPIRNAARSLEESESLLNKSVKSAVKEATPDLNVAQQINNLKKELDSLTQESLGTTTPSPLMAGKIAGIKKEIANLESGASVTATSEITGTAPSTIDPIANVRAIARKLSNLTSDIQGQDAVPFRKVWGTMKEINDLIDGAKRQGGAELGALLKLKRGMWEALDKVATSSSGRGMDLLKQANMTFRREIASDTVDEVITKNFGRALEGTEQLSSRAAPAINALKDAIKKDPFLKDSFAPGDFEKIITTLEKIKTLPVRGAPAGADAGSKNLFRQSTIGGAAGGLIAGAMGAPVTTGVMAGTIAGVGGSMIISKALQTPIGRQILIKMADSPTGLDYPKLAILGQILRAQTTTSPKTMQEEGKSP